MNSLPFSQEFVGELASERTPAMTLFMQCASLLGEIEGYMLATVLLFALYNKRLAVQAAIIVVLTMTINHILKIILQNPRPFVAEDSYLQNWAVSAQNAAELASEYSTPSGHAMAAAAFYAFLFLKIRNTAFRILCISAIILTGISRPYMGVHYAEDILIGWPIGGLIGFVGFGYADKLTNWWSGQHWLWQATVGVGFSLVIWGITIFILDRPFSEQPLAFISYLGFLLGMLLAFPVERQFVNFEPSKKSASKSVTRVLVMGSILAGTMIVLEILLALIWNEQTLGGHALRYFRYALVAASGVLLAPYLFRKMGIA